MYMYNNNNLMLLDPQNYTIAHVHVHECTAYLYTFNLASAMLLACVKGGEKMKSELG